MQDEILLNAQFFFITRGVNLKLTYLLSFPGTLRNLLLSGKTKTLINFSYLDDALSFSFMHIYEADLMFKNYEKSIYYNNFYFFFCY
jgi:hypothetical protein